MSIEIDFSNQVIKAAPVAGTAVAGGVAQATGMSISDWFYVAAIIYTLAQTAVLIFKTVVDAKRKKGDPPNE